METWTGAGLLLHFLWTDFASSLRSNSENVLNVQCRSKSPSATKIGPVSIFFLMFQNRNLKLHGLALP